MYFHEQIERVDLPPPFRVRRAHPHQARASLLIVKVAVAELWCWMLMMWVKYAADGLICKSAARRPDTIMLIDGGGGSGGVGIFEITTQEEMMDSVCASGLDRCFSALLFIYNI